MSNYAHFQTIINFRVDLETLKTEKTSGWTRAVKGTGQAQKAKPKTIKKESTREAKDVEVVEW